MSGAFQPSVSPDGATLVYSGFSTDGFDLYSMPFVPRRFLPAQPYANARLDSPADPDAESDSPDAVPADAAQVPFVAETKIYQPWKYMYPRTWDLRLLTNPLGPGESAYIATNALRSRRQSRHRGVAAAPHRARSVGGARTTTTTGSGRRSG